MKSELINHKLTNELQFQESITNGTEGINKTSQVIIVPPNLSVPEVIVIQPSQSLSRPMARQILPKTGNKKALRLESPKSGMLRKESAKGSSGKSPLMVKLQEKIDRLLGYLPKSEFLTPKQYDMINRKLDSIISVFDTVNAKKLKKGSGKKNSGRKAAEEQKNDGNVVECVVATQNVVKQIYETPVYAYVCNYN